MSTTPHNHPIPDDTPSPAQLGAPVDAEAATKELVPRLAIGVGVVAVLVVALGGLARVVQDQEVNALDAFASPFVHSFASPLVDALMTGASTVGSVPSLLALAAATALLALARRRPGLAAIVAVASVGVVVVNEVLKRVVARPRPKLDWATVLPDYSFPSGHTMDSIVVLAAIAFVAWALFGRRVGIVATGVAIGLALLIGFSRIYLGAHYLTDVIGGYLAGAIWLIAVLWAFRAAWRRRTREVATSGSGWPHHP
ncbi:MAG TPA: phosphatase PAP2 family protein [Candidatus Limnocylindrales bacterium]